MGNVWSKKTTNIDSGSDSPALWRVDLLDFITSANGITTTGGANCLVKTDGSGGITATAKTHIILNDSNPLPEGLRISNEASNSDTIIIFEEGSSVGTGSMFLGFDGGGNRLVFSKMGVVSPYHLTIDRDSGLLTANGGITANGATKIETTSKTALDVRNGSGSVFSVDTLNERVSIYNIPTNVSGLSSGDIWSDSGTLKIV